MKRILRISSFPTIEKSGMGLHPSKLCGIKGYYTFYLTPKESSERLFKPINTEIIEKYFFSLVRPKKTNLLKKIVFNIKRILSILQFSLFGIKIIVTKKVDIVHIHSPMYILIGYFGFLLKKDIYITFHGSDFHRIKNKKWYMFFSRIFTKVFIISPDMRKKLSEIHGKEKIVLVFNGIDSDIYKNYNYEREKYIIAVGSLKEEKGFKYLIESFANLIHNNKILNSYRLFIIGDGLLKEELTNLIIKNKLEKNIFLLGHKERDEIVELYNKSEIFVLSSISEGFPKVVLEALACGCKVVATKVGSVPNILKFTKFELSEPKNVNSLEKSILNTINSDFVYYDDIIALYSWDNVKKVYEDNYRKGGLCIA